MALTSTIRPGYAWRTIIIGVACVVFGLWGLWDYAVAIPAKQRAFDRFVVIEQARDALGTDPAAAEYSDLLTTARTAVRAESAAVVDRVAARSNLEARGIDDPVFDAWLQLLLLYAADQVELPEGFEPDGDHEQARQLMDAARTDSDFDWLQHLLITWVGLNQRRLPDTPLEGLAAVAYERNRALVDAAGNPTRPSKFDRLTQWGFMACLPCAPYFFFVFASARRKRYELDDEGTLHTPEGTWTRDEIADIDMSRWMAKSVAWVVHADGSRIKLDDFHFKKMHLVVGALASRFHPGQWTEEAKKVKPEDQAGGPPHEESAEDPVDADVAAAESGEPGG